MKKKLLFLSILLGSILLLCICQLTKKPNYSNMETAVRSNLEEKISEIWDQIQYENAQRRHESTQRQYKNAQKQHERIQRLYKRAQRVFEIFTKVSDYLYDKVPEIRDYASYISEKSDGKAHLTVQPYTELKEIIKLDGTNMGNYYMVYVGEQWENHSVDWDWFAVSEDINDILWMDIVEMEYYTLEEWRASSSYRNFE